MANKNDSRAASVSERFDSLKEEFLRTYIIRLIATHTGEFPEFNGQYVKEYEPDGPNGTVLLECTNDPNEARHFLLKSEAMEYYSRQSLTVPQRADGKPNRPLTAFMACFGTVEQCAALPPVGPAA